MDARDVLTRGVEKILPDKEGLLSLMEKGRITIYQGFDPTNPSLHIGNFIGVSKLSQFQKLGHRVIFLIGDFTALIGDPTDKSSTRRTLTKEEISQNLKDYKKQIENVLAFDGDNPAEVMFNSTWLSKLPFEEIVELTSNFTVQQMIERDFFQDRLRENKPIYLHEFLYPVMQGYDSVAMGVDLEIGGSDQLFNMLAGRTLVTKRNSKEKFVLTLKLLTDPAGKKMGKSEGNAIFLSDQPNDVFAKIMAFSDEMIPDALELLTDLPLGLAKSKNPLEVKKTIASSILSQLHSKEVAASARKNFENSFQKKSPDFNLPVSLQENLLKTLVGIDGIGSLSRAKRLIIQGAVDVDGVVVKDPSFRLTGGENLKVGKRVFVKVGKE